MLILNTLNMCLWKINDKKIRKCRRTNQWKQQIDVKYIIPYVYNFKDIYEFFEKITFQK